MNLVVGATGSLGGALTQSLLAQGKTVRILARPHSDYKPLEEAGAQVFIGDLKDPASLGPACQGADVIITTANSALRGGDDNPQTVDWEGNRNLIDAAKEAGVSRFVFMSAQTADAGSPIPFLAAKGKAEAYLQASGVPYTVMAPVAFMEVWIGMVVGVPVAMEQPVTLVGEGRRKHSFISAADVAAFTLVAVDHAAALNSKLIIGGPEPLSYLEAVATYERVLGRSIPVRHVEPGAAVPGLPEVMAAMVGSFDMYDSPIDMSSMVGTYGVGLTSLEDYVRRTCQEGC